MTHDYHPDTTARKILCETCERCSTKKLGELDAEYLRNACGIDHDALRAFVGRYPQLWDTVMCAPALPVQRRHLETLDEVDV